MVSRKNKYLKQVRSEKSVPRYQLRKLSVGVVSVMAGTALYLGTATTNVYADTVNNADSSILVSVTKNDGSSSKTLISASAAPTKNNSSSAMNTTSSAVSSSSSVDSSATSTPKSDSSASAPISASAAPASDASISASVTKDNGSSASASISESAAPAFDASISTSVTKDNGSSSDSLTSGSVTSSSNADSAASSTVTVNVLELAKPTIKAPQEVTVTQGSTFDPLKVATATDANGNPITITQSNILSDDVNVNKPGTYHVTYVVKDKYGNVSDPVMITVKVVGKTKQGSSSVVTNTGSSNQDGQASGNKFSNLTSNVKNENTNGSMSRVGFRGNSSTQNLNESVDGNTTEKKASLPQTGNEKKGILELVGLGLVDLAAFLGFSRRKKA